jgi:hypothetical protein
MASVKRLTTAKPKPCPLALVVKSGVNSLDLTSSEIHQPTVLNFNHRAAASS